MMTMIVSHMGRVVPATPVTAKTARLPRRGRVAFSGLGDALVALEGGAAATGRTDRRESPLAKLKRALLVLAGALAMALGLQAVAFGQSPPTATGSVGTQAVQPAPPIAADISIRLDEREVRAAGIVTVSVEPERGATDLVFPGTVAVPPQQTRIVAAPAAGMIEAMLVAADETVAAGRPIARLTSPDVVEA